MIIKLRKGQVEPLLRSLLELQSEKMSVGAARAVLDDLKAVQTAYETVFAPLIEFEEQNRAALHQEFQAFISGGRDDSKVKPDSLLARHLNLRQQIQAAADEPIDLDLHGIASDDLDECRVAPRVLAGLEPVLLPSRAAFAGKLEFKA